MKRWVFKEAITNAYMYPQLYGSASAEACMDARLEARGLAPPDAAASILIESHLCHFTLHTLHTSTACKLRHVYIAGAVERYTGRVIANARGNMMHLLSQLPPSQLWQLA